MKIFRFYLDCKSAYAGSIPTSASKLKPRGSMIYGVFYWLKFAVCSATFGKR
ncbi:hypothetical protein C4K22_3618 [Pseudomonas chlororaphis subsp. aurantiaca]|nr:hypothetical protein C4K24_3451 [Pseudomonas chlororaphis subsp. aurantiaca]AZD36360.1 hypothetical protein C4K22_3618 [Pseudomonas chlororaphis subsp. aurantiaca]AZD42699.1 hypothetical protein C4K21_3626 [Pseudomonas chlororaphis subsp. aurantiaca]